MESVHFISATAKCLLQCFKLVEQCELLWAHYAVARRALQNIAIDKIDFAAASL
jgi:hypothetical protein